MSGNKRSITLNSHGHGNISFLYYLLGLSALVVMTLGVVLFVHTIPVRANTVPPYAHAWYITNPDTATNGKMYSLGKYDGTWDNNNCPVGQSITTLALLDFGQVSYQSSGGYGGYGTLDYASGYPFVSDSTILTAAEQYARGYFVTTGSCPHLILVFGLNNYNQCPYGGSCSPSTAGYQWGNLVNDFHTWLVSVGYQGYISGGVGDDMEQPGGGQSWDCPPKTRGFVDGFNNHDPLSANFLDFGTAWYQGTCWLASDVYYVAYGAKYNYPLPETYTLSALNSWTGLGQGYMYYQGELTECDQGDPISGNNCTYPGSEWTPYWAWTELKNSISQTNLYYSSNIRYQYKAPGQ